MSAVSGEMPECWKKGVSCAWRMAGKEAKMRNDIMSKLSVVLPAYNEELMVGKTCRVLAQVLTEAKIPYELVVMNDG